MWRLIAAALAVALVFDPAVEARDRPEAAFADLGLLLSSKANHYGYAYAPAIVKAGGRYHMVFCSYGRPGIWDYLRYAMSEDGRTWTEPVTLLEGTDPEGERAACDPALVRYQAPGDRRPFYYLFYSGNAVGVQTAMFVARAETIGGAYAKWTRRGTWEVDAPDPAIIIGPANPKPDGSGFYGAGQQSVVVENGRLVSWYTDDTTCPAACSRLFRTASADPTSWPPGTQTDAGEAHSVDVKRARTDGYVMYGIAPAHAEASALVRRRSIDGLHWSAPETLCDAACFRPFAHNVGVSADTTGRLLDESVVVAYGAPAVGAGACGTCMGRWDLFGAAVSDPGPSRRSPRFGRKRD